MIRSHLRTARKWAPFLLISAIGSALVACGGGGGGHAGTGSTSSAGGGGTVYGQGTASMKVSLALPTGYVVPSGGLFISGGLVDKTAISGTTATIKTWQQGRQLVAATDAKGNPVMMGFVGTGHLQLSPASTAAALVYFASAGYGAPYETQESLYESVERDTDIQKVATDVSTELVKSGNISSAIATFRTTALTAAEALLGGTTGVVPELKAKANAVTIDPSATTKSGVQVVYGDTANQILASNTLRRRVLLFIDQVSTTDSSGAVTPAAKALQEQELPPAQGKISALDLLGSLGGEPQTTFAPAVAIPAVPSTLSAVNYTVTAAGGGSGPGNTAGLSAKEQSDLTAFLQKSFVKDFFLPIFNRVLVSNTLTQTSVGEKTTFYALLEGAVDSNSAAAQQFVTTNFPNAVNEMQTGDYRGANLDIMRALTDSTKQSQLANFYSTIVASANLPGYGGTTSRTSYVLAWIGHAIVAPNTGSFNFPQFQAYDQSNRTETWQVTANNYKVSLTPATSTVDSSNASQKTSTLKAAVTLPNGLPQGDSLVYSWSTSGKHGDLIVSTGSGVSFKNISDTSAIYDATVGLAASDGDDTVTVEAGLKDSSGAITPIGAAVATVTVKAQGDIALVPSIVSVQPNTSSDQILASTHYPQNLTNGSASLQWSCPNKLGTLVAPTGPTSVQSVTYSAGPNEGSEVVTCAYLSHGVKISSSTMTIKIEKKPTIEFGQVVYRGYNFLDGIQPYSTAGAFFRIPKVPGATNYAVHCYNFNDPIVYGNHLDFNIAGNGAGADGDVSADGHILGTFGADGSFYKWGPGSSSSKYGIIGEVEAEVGARLQGMIIQVTVSY